MSREGTYPDLFTSEQKISKIKTEIDRFEQKLNQVISGYVSDKNLSDECHILMLSIRELSTEVTNIQKMLGLVDQDPDLRARAYNLRNQAIVQIGRIQSLGVRVQQYLRRPPAAAAAVPKTEQFVSPLDEFGPSETQPSNVQPPQLQQQQQLNPSQLQLDDQLAHDMERLESDLVQVNEVFTTLAACVQDQGSLVDSIDKNVEIAYEQVEAGTKHLDSAVKHKKSNRRRKCICLALVLVGIAFLGLIIGVSVRT